MSERGRGGNGGLRPLAAAVRALVFTGVAGFGAPAPTAGQEAPARRDSAAADSIPVFHQAPVIVSVLRTPAVSGTLPFAITSRDLARRVPGPGLSLDDALRTIPGLQIDNRHTDALGDRIVLRGFGARSQFGVRGIQILVDGIPATMPDGQTTLSHVDHALLTRAEVLRGPAAAAYGNAAGGVILLTTKTPPPTPLRQEAVVTAGANGLLRLRSTTGGSSGSTGWVASVSGERKDGFRPHSSATRTHLTGRLDSPVGGGHLRLVAHGVSYDARNPGALTPEQFGGDPRQAQAFNVTQATGETGLHGQLGATWDRPVGQAGLEATVYALGRTLDNPIPPSIIDLDRLAGGARVLLRSRGAGEREGEGEGFWAVGADAALQADDRRNFENDGGARGALTLDQTERVTNVALHGHALLPAFERVGIFLGARYDRVAFSATDRLTAAGDPDDSGRRTMDAISPTAGVRVDVSDRVALFGNVSTAFETPTTTELVNRPSGAGGFNEALEPQRTVSYEIGGRASAGAGLEVQASLYQARVRDALVAFEVESAPGRQYFRNAGSARHRGVEVLAELRTPRFDAIVAYSRTAAEFVSYATAERSYDGLEVPGVRPWAVGVTLAGRPAPDVALEIDYRTTGAMPVDDANETAAPGFTLLGLRASGPAFRVGGFEAGAYAGIENALDETYVASVVPNAFGGRFFEPGPGRTFYIGLETRFPVARAAP